MNRTPTSPPLAAATASNYNKTNNSDDKRQLSVLETLVYNFDARSTISSPQSNNFSSSMSSPSARIVGGNDDVSIILEQRPSLVNNVTTQKLEDIMGILGEMIDFGGEEEEVEQEALPAAAFTIDKNSGSSLAVSNSSNYPFQLKQSKHKLDDVMKLIGDVIQNNKRAPENTVDFTNNALLTSNLLSSLLNSDDYGLGDDEDGDSIITDNDGGGSSLASVAAASAPAATTLAMSPASQIVAMSGKGVGESLRAATGSSNLMKPTFLNESPDMQGYYNDIEQFRNGSGTPPKRTLSEKIGKTGTKVVQEYLPNKLRSFSFSKK